MFSVKEILAATGGRVLSTANLRKRVFGVSIDSRTIKRGELFIAVRGKRFDGHDFITDAAKKGASLVIAASGIKPINPGVPAVVVRDTLQALGDIAAYHRKRFSIPVVGITGSNGKTTVKEMVAAISAKRYRVLKNKGTENNLVGLPLAILTLRNQDLAVLEMGANHWGEIGRLAQVLKPTIGVITNIGASHLEFLEDKEGVLRAKAEMVRELKRESILILNGDDQMLSRIKPRCKKISFGLGKKNDFMAEGVNSNGNVTFILNGAYLFSLNMLGRHNIYNALAAIAVCSALDIDIATMRSVLLNFESPSMRMELEKVKGISVINDSYNSNPLSLKRAIETFSDLKTGGRKILITGDMLELGKRSRFFHTLAGRLIAGASIDELVGVGELSRFTVSAAKRSGMKKGSLWSCRDPEEALEIAKKIVKPGDVLLIKGSRAMRMERIIEGL